jgi:hypothetical protein
MTRIYVALAIFVLVMIGEGVLLWDMYRDGEAKVRAADTAAAARQRKLDDSLSQTTVQALKADNAHLRATLAQPALHVLCVPQIHYVRTSPAAGSAQPAKPLPAGAGAGGVPTGNADVDLGSALRDVALAASVVADYRDRTWQWAIDQEK